MTLRGRNGALAQKTPILWRYRSEVSKSRTKQCTMGRAHCSVWSLSAIQVMGHVLYVSRRGGLLFAEFDVVGSCLRTHLDGTFRSRGKHFRSKRDLSIVKLDFLVVVFGFVKTSTTSSPVDEPQ
eukprot:1000374-Prymnesium_polylepis.1